MRWGLPLNNCSAAFERVAMTANRLPLLGVSGARLGLAYERDRGQAARK